MESPSELKAQMLRIEGAIENLKDPARFVDEDVLEITRSQSWTGKGWDTTSYTLLLVAGGPNITLQVPDGVLRGSWGMERVTLPLSEKAKEKCREITELLDEWFEEV